MGFDKGFGHIRKLIWPIHHYELKKFLPLSLLMFCLVFNYTLLRDAKDALVVNAVGAGIIPFLKLWCVMPAAVLFVFFYVKLNNILKREYVFYLIILLFLVFFGSFALLIYPNINILHPSAQWLAQAHKSFPIFGGFINIIGYWSYSIFYVIAEIWGSVMITLMFWQFANQIVKINESKRFYGLFVVISNVVLIFSGKCMKFCSQGIKQYYHGEDVWQVSLYLMVGVVILMGILAMCIYRWIYTNVLTNRFYYDGVSQKNKKEGRLSLRDSFKIIIHSPELRLIAILVMSYGITINLIEVQWKEQVKLYFGGDKGAYGGFMGDYSFWSGIITVIFGLFIGSNVLRAFSWFKAAIILPVFMLIGGSVFFCFIISINAPVVKKIVETFIIVIGIRSAAMATFLGVVVVTLAKTIKYTLFDPTKEMAYIPLSEEIKTTGKAAVDVIGGRAGKSGGAFIQSLLMMLLGSINVIDFAPISFSVFVIICLLWVFAVQTLGEKFKGVERRKTKIKINVI